MTGYKEPKVANIPTSLDEYPDIDLKITRTETVTAQRAVNGQWYIEVDDGVFYTVDQWLDSRA